MNTSFKAIVAAASALIIAAPAFAGGKGDVILEPEVAQEEVIVPAAPSLPGAGVAVAAGVGALALAAAISSDDDDDDDDDSSTTTTE